MVESKSHGVRMHRGYLARYFRQAGKAQEIAHHELVQCMVVIVSVSAVLQTRPSLCKMMQKSD